MLEARATRVQSGERERGYRREEERAKTVTVEKKGGREGSAGEGEERGVWREGKGRGDERV